MTWITNARARPTRYSVAAKAMHWVVAFAVIAMIPEGMAMKRLIAEGPTKESLYNLHEAVGALVRRCHVDACYLSIAVTAPRPTCAKSMACVSRRRAKTAKERLY